MPAIPVTYNIEDVQRFFDTIPEPTKQKPVQLPVGKGTRKKDLSTRGTKSLLKTETPDPAQIPELITATKSAKVSKRRSAVAALGKLAHCKPAIYDAVGPLQGLLADENPRIRQYALTALDKIGIVSTGLLRRIANDPSEKDYNIAIAKRLLRKKG